MTLSPFGNRGVIRLSAGRISFYPFEFLGFTHSYL